MNFRNNGCGESNILQNQFTAYLMTAVKRRKAAYLAAQDRLASHEISVDPVELYSGGETEPDQEDFLLESATLAHALAQLGERDRYILLSRVLQGQDFEILAKELGLSYKGVTTAYYRVLRKLRAAMGGEEG